MRLSTTTASRALRRIESTTTTTTTASTCARSFILRQQHSLPRLSTRSTTSQSRPRTKHNSHVLRPLPPHSAGVATTRSFHTSSPSPAKQSSSSSSSPKIAHNNEPVPTEAPQTNFSQMDMLGQTPVPSTSIDVCAPDGFTLNSGVVISHGDGAVLLGGEAFVFRPWAIRDRPLINSRGQFELDEESLAIFGSVWPRPDLLIVGTGRELRQLSVETRRAIGNLGMRVDVLDTRNAASQFNLLATERGVDDVAAVLVPLGWRP